MQKLKQHITQRRNHTEMAKELRDLSATPRGDGVPPTAGGAPNYLRSPSPIVPGEHVRVVRLWQTHLVDELLTQSFILPF